MALATGWKPDSVFMMANCQQTLGLGDEALAVLSEVLAGREEGLLAKLILGNIAFRRRQFAKSICLLREAALLALALPGLQLQTYHVDPAEVVMVPCV